MSLGDAGRGASAIVDVGTLRPKNLTLCGYFLGAELLLRPDSHATIARIIDEVASGDIRVRGRSHVSALGRRGSPQIHRESASVRACGDGPLTRGPCCVPSTSLFTRSKVVRIPLRFTFPRDQPHNVQ